MSDTDATIAVVAAILGLVGVFSTSVIAQISSRNQQARQVLFEPARAFARDALGALAALRNLTPPPFRPNDIVTHRNENLLSERALQLDELVRCNEEIDKVRVARADVRLVFLPHSRAAEFTRRVLEAQRKALEAAGRFYAEYELVPADERLEWRETRGRDLRDEYKSWRATAYFNLDRFFDDVGDRVRSPSWNPRRVNTRWDPRSRVTLDANLVDRSGRWTNAVVAARNYSDGLAQLDAKAAEGGRAVGYIRSMDRE
jgi:hypothetical protein